MNALDTDALSASSSEVADELRRNTNDRDALVTEGRQLGMAVPDVFTWTLSTGRVVRLEVPAELSTEERLELVTYQRDAANFYEREARG